MCSTLQRRKVEECCELLDFLALDFEELQRILREAYLHKKLESYLRQMSRKRSVVVRGQLIYQTDDGWFSQRTGTKICNGRVQVDEVLPCRSVPTQLVGSVQIGDQQTRFQISKQDVQRKGLFECIKLVVPEFDFRKGWSSESEHLTYRLHEPSVRQNADVVGWRDGRYWFPRFSLVLGGDVRTDETSLITSVSPPALMCALPAMLSKYELSLLSRRGRESRIFWATAA